MVEIVLAWLLDQGVRIALIAVGAWIAHKLLIAFIGRVVRQAIKPSHFKNEQDQKQREDTLINIIRGVLGVLIWITAGLMIISEFRIEIGPLLAGAGVAGIALGFGAQYLIRDVIAGLFIILENQYRIGDVVSLDDTAGVVEDITLRISVLRDLDGNVHHVPNGSIQRATNLTKEMSGINIDIGVAYDSDLDLVIATINQVGKSLAAEEKWHKHIVIPPQFLRITDFGDNAIELKVTGKTTPGKKWDVSGEFRKRILRAFDEAGIEIPFPQRVVHQAAPKKTP